jgi:hypothetical protein
MDYQLDRNWQHRVIRYPDPAIESIDGRFKKYILGSAALERLYTGARWTEGPVWFGDGGYRQPVGLRPVCGNPGRADSIKGNQIVDHHVLPSTIWRENDDTFELSNLLVMETAHRRANFIDRL